MPCGVANCIRRLARRDDAQKSRPIDPVFRADSVVLRLAKDFEATVMLLVRRLAGPYSDIGELPPPTSIG
jgi:hypothetical protein